MRTHMSREKPRAEPLRATLRVGPTDDPHEREASRIADHVMRATELPPRPQRDVDAPSLPPELGSHLGTGEPLDAQTRGFMEPRFGHSFERVRIHADGEAAASARSVGALAYTVGRDIVFGPGAYAPKTGGGQRLIAHELTHVLQQSSTHETVLQREPTEAPAASAAGADFDAFLAQLTTLELAAAAEGYDFNDRVTAFRKIFYDSASAAKTYAGAVVGGGAWNILIPGAAGVKSPASWATTALAGAVDYLRKHQVLPIAGRSADIGHLLAGADAKAHPTSISVGAGTVKLRSNVEATTFIGDLGSVVTEYIHGSTASFRDVAMKRSPLLDAYYDGAHAMASPEDMAGNADAYALSLDPAKTLAENLRAYYTAASGGVKKRFTSFATMIGLGTLKGATFTGDTPSWRSAMQDQVFESALAYAAGKGWKSDVVLVLKDPGPGLFVPTFWEMYWNVSGWVLDIFVDRTKKEVAKE